MTAGAYTLAQIQGMQFRPADNANGSTGFQFNVTDSGGTANGGIDSISQFILITVDPLNDAPTVTTTGTQLGYTENDGAVVIDSGLTLADVDSTDLTGATVRIASGFSNSEDVLAFTDQLGITGSYTAATGILTLSGTASVADYQTALRSVTYENTSELPSTTNRVISFQVDDGTAVGSDTRTLTVASINDDPTNNGSLPTDVAVLEGTSSGIDLSAIDFGDLDHNNQLLTVTLTTSTGGNLYASTDIDVIVAGSGTGFMTLTGGIADLNTFFDSATRIQYLHGTANLAGDNVDSIQVQIRDNGNTGSGGGGDITLGTVNIDITNVNDAPAGTNKTVSTAEDIDYVLTTADFGFNDPNDSPSDNLAGVVITTAPSNGTLYVDASGDGIVDGGEALGATDTVAVADILANRLKFKPAPDANGVGYDSFGFQVQDDGGTANGGVDTDPTANTITIDVTNINDAPVFGTVNASPTFTENGGAVGVFSATAVDPVELGDLIDTLQLTVDGLADGSDEILVVDGQAIELTHLNSETTAANGYDVDVSVAGSTATVVITKTGGFSPAAAEALVDGLAYNDTSENPQGAARVITLTSIKDDGGTANGGADTTAIGIASSVSIDTVNDDPTNAGSLPTDLSFLEDTQGKLDLSAIDLSDVDAGSGNLTLTITSANGHLQTLGWPGVTLGGSQSELILTGNLTDLNDFLNDINSIDYEHATPHAAGDNVDLITVQIRDNGNTGSGGGGDITLGTVNIDITDVNDAPAGTNKTVSTAEDTDYVFTTADFGFSDANDSPPDNLAGVVIATAPSNGTLYVDANGDGIVDGGEALGATDTVAVADILANRLKFKPAADAYGVGYDSFDFQVQDDGGTANGGVDTDPTANTITIDVTAAGDPPVIGGTDTATVTEDTDPDLDNLLEANDALTISDPDVGESSFQPATIVGTYGSLTIDAAGNWSYAADNTQLSIQQIDAGESVSDVLTVSTADGTTHDITITIDGAEDAPTLDNLIADQSTAEDAPFSFTVPANTFSDVDASDTLTYTATLSDDSPLPARLSFDALTQTFSGTPTNADIGTISVKVTADDGTSTVNDVFDLTVTNTNDPPVIGGVNSATVTEDIDPDLDNLLEANDALTISDPDVGESSFQAATIVGTYGSLTIDAAGNWSYSADNTQLSIQQIDAGESVSDVLTVSTADGTTHDITITIDGAEDAPTLDNLIADQSTAEDALFSFTVPANTFSDVDASDTLTYTATLSDDSPAAGLAELRCPDPDLLGDADQQ